MKKFCFLLLVILAFSCGEKVVEEPNNLIEKEKMIAIYYDLAIYNSIRSTNPASLKENNIDEIMPYLYKKHSIDSLQYVSSDKYYASIPLEYQLMYEEVESRLLAASEVYDEARKKRADSIKAANEKRSDSIQKLRSANVPERK